MLNQNLYTLVDKNGNPVYTTTGTDGHFAKCASFGDMMTFTKCMGWSQMMALAQWSQSHAGNGRMKVYPAKMTISIEKIPIE